MNIQNPPARDRRILRVCWWHNVRRSSFSPYTLLRILYYYSKYHPTGWLLHSVSHVIILLSSIKLTVQTCNRYRLIKNIWEKNNIITIFDPILHALILIDYRSTRIYGVVNTTHSNLQDNLVEIYIVLSVVCHKIFCYHIWIYLSRVKVFLNIFLLKIFNKTLHFNKK